MLIEFKVSLPIEIKYKKREDIFVSRCKVLDVYSQGSTKKEALDACVEAIQTFLLSCFERGVLDETLRECGFRTVKKSKKVTKPHRSKDVETVEIPLPLSASGRVGHHCHA